MARFYGSSTGLFCILLAYLNNPEKNIIVSGIGIKTGGETFYGSNKLRTNRSNVDQKLFFYLKKRLNVKLFQPIRRCQNIAMYLYGTVIIYEYIRVYWFTRFWKINVIKKDIK